MNPDILPGVDPDICADPFAPGRPDAGILPKPGAMAQFYRADGDVLLYAALTRVGAVTAHAAVGLVRSGPGRCPGGVAGVLPMVVRPMPVPRLGDRAAGLRFETRVPGGRIVFGRLVAFACRDVAAVLCTVGTSDVNSAETTAIVRAAARKLTAALA